MTAAYDAFKPLVLALYPANPFANFKTKFDLLDNAPATSTPALFLQYYYDFFDDLLNAYNEFRCKGLELLCACCPSESFFPRHLTLGLLYPDSSTYADGYRQSFLASSAISGCGQRSREVVLLFQRMVEMINQFTLTPILRPISTVLTHIPMGDPQIIITPSKLGAVPLSDKAIPYYYQQTGTPPLYQLWSAEKSRRSKANQNWSYRSVEYQPAAPAFITDALRYNLEPYNFLRIEGHLGKNYQTVLNTLASLKSSYRLPIEIIALRTGSSANNLPEQSQSETLHNFLIRHPGIQHKAGVPSGGTFILVYHNASDQDKGFLGTAPGNIIADFFLPYFVEDSNCRCQMLTRA